jgi:hypothetical protein
MAAVTREELLEIVYRYNPRGLDIGALGWADSEERQRQLAVVQRGIAEGPTWKAMLRRLAARYSLMDDSGHLLFGEEYDPAYSANIDIPGGSLGFHVCLLGPYYGIHRTGIPGEEPVALDLAREIEATYPGYQPIPPELGDEVVPDVALNTEYFGSATIYHCLLSEVWKWSSGPRQPYPPLPPPDVPQPGRFVLDRGDEPQRDGEPLDGDQRRAR